MLTLRLSATTDRASALVAALAELDGVHRLIETPSAGSRDEVVISADLDPPAADRVIGRIHRLGGRGADYVIARSDVIAPTPLGLAHTSANQPIAWVELIGEARLNARLIGRYIALMGVAAVVAALGVVTDNPILIVGAMAVSPDLLPICATCVGLVGRRPRLVWRAFTTLAVGLGFVIALAAVLAAVLEALGAIDSGFKASQTGLGALASTDYSTILVALAAGVAAILAFETRASAAVGVAISVTTIPASAYAGVALGVGGGDGAAGALLVLAVNVALLIVSGTATLAFQHVFASRNRPA